MVLDQVKEIIVDALGCDEDAVVLEASLKDDLLVRLSTKLYKSLINELILVNSFFCFWILVVATSFIAWVILLVVLILLILFLMLLIDDIWIIYF